MQQLLKMSATRLAAAMRAGELSPVTVLEASIARLESVNPALNAVVANRLEGARRDAKAAERRIARTRSGDSLPPFLGVPCTVKEAIAVEGLPNTVGCKNRKGTVAPKDATAVSRMREAGFIPIGVTNVPEACFWHETDNLLYGRTHNPHDHGRSAGGSSGGEGAAIGAAIAPVGLGSDVGGSIRIPAMFCGIFGHKPSSGLVPFTGHWPFYDDPAVSPWSRDVHIYNSIGPMARAAEDLMPILRVIAGPDGVDGTTAARSLGDPASVTWNGRKVFVLEAPEMDRVPGVSAELRAKTAQAAAHFRDLGASVEAVDPRIFRRAFPIWACSLAALEMPRMDVMMHGGTRPSITLEALKHLTGAPDHTLPSLQYFVGERIFPLVPGKAKARAEAVAMESKLTEMLGDGNIFVMPTHPRAAPKHRWPMLRPFDHAYTGIWNILRMPVTAVPLGLNEGGLPLGVQVAAGLGLDHVAIAAALALEARFGGWVPPAG